MGNLTFIIELIAAQLLLLYHYPKRRYHHISLPIGILLTILICYFLPLPEKIMADPILGFLRFMTMLCLSMIPMLLSFSCKYGAIISGSIAGYAVQHISYQITTMFLTIDSLKDHAELVELLVFIISYTICFSTFSRFIAKRNYYENYDSRFIVISACIVFICIFVYRFARLSATDTITTICIAMYAIISCSLALIIQYGAYGYIKLKYDNKTLATILAQKEMQYQISKQNIELFNIKYHDLKHQLEHMTEGERKDLYDITAIYDNQIRSGLDVLDVTINEKLKIMNDRKITINFSGDGRILSFMNEVDIYSLFGNAIDNAIEALSQVDDINRRVIDIRMEERGDLVVVFISNYFSGQLLEENGVILTSKTQDEGYHGYGIKSMEFICKKYDGDLSIKTDKNIFKVSFSFLRRSDD